MRDLETIGTALHAAETGHMVFSTLHTLDAVETINRIISIFPPPEQKQIRLQLAAVLRAVVSQRLVRRCDSDGRVPAVEVMINTAYIRECILVPEKTRSIRDAISAGTSQYGMQTFDQSLWDLFQAGLINYEIALENASNADDFKLRMQGIASTADISRQAMQTSGWRSLVALLGQRARASAPFGFATEIHWNRHADSLHGILLPIDQWQSIPIRRLIAVDALLLFMAFRTPQEKGLHGRRTLRVRGRRARAAYAFGGRTQATAAQRVEADTEFGQTLVELIIRRLKDQGYLNDSNYAAIYSSLRRDNEKFGRMRVVTELKVRGVHGEVIEKAVSDAYDAVSEEKTGPRLPPPQAPEETDRIRSRPRGFSASWFAPGFRSKTIFTILKKWDVDEETLTALEERELSNTAYRLGKPTWPLRLKGLPCEPYVFFLR